MKTEEVQLPAITETPKVAEMIKNSGVEPTKAEAHVLAFADKFAELHELSRPLATLNKENPSKEDAKIARENRLKVVKVRTGTESIKDDRKKLILAEANLIQSTNNIIRDACILTEAEYEEIEKKEERVEAQKRAELKQTRIELLTPYEVDTQFLPLDTMDEETFERLLSNEKEKFEAVKQLRAKQEAERIEAERKAEEERQAQIKAEQERIEAQRIENERLKKEAEAREAEFQAERHRQELERIANAKKLAEEQAKAKAEADKLRAENEAKLKAEQEAKAKLEAELKAKKEAEAKAEADRLAKIEADKKEAEKLAKAPIKKQLTVWVDGFSIKDFENENALASDIIAKFNSFKNWAKSEIEKL